MKNVKGFTLIELMIVIAILGILIAIALPAYNDYTIRARVSEGLNIAAATKLAVGETRLSTGDWPSDNATAGSPTTITSTYVSGIVVSNAPDIEITLQNIDAQVDGDTILLEPTFVDNTIRWTCDGGTVDARFLPANCR